MNRDRQNKNENNIYEQRHMLLLEWSRKKNTETRLLQLY